MNIGILGHKEFVVSRRDMLSSISSSGVDYVAHIEEIDWSVGEIWKKIEFEKSQRLK